MMRDVTGLTQLQQVWGNRRTQSGERGTGRHGCVPDDCGRQLTGVHVQQPVAGQKTKFTHQHQGQGDSGVTCRDEESCKMALGKQSISEALDHFEATDRSPTPPC